jgi:hypothetical protein
MAGMAAFPRQPPVVQPVAQLHILPMSSHDGTAANAYAELLFSIAEAVAAAQSVEAADALVLALRDIVARCTTANALRSRLFYSPDEPATPARRDPSTHGLSRVKDAQEALLAASVAAWNQTVDVATTVQSPQQPVAVEKTLLRVAAANGYILASRATAGGGYMAPANAVEAVRMCARAVSAPAAAQLGALEATVVQWMDDLLRAGAVIVAAFPPPPPSWGPLTNLSPMEQKRARADGELRCATAMFAAARRRSADLAELPAMCNTAVQYLMTAGGDHAEAAVRGTAMELRFMLLLPDDAQPPVAEYAALLQVLRERAGGEAALFVECLDGFLTGCAAALEARGTDARDHFAAVGRLTVLPAMEALSTSPKFALSVAATRVLRHVRWTVEHGFMPTRDAEAALFGECLRALLHMPTVEGRIASDSSKDSAEAFAVEVRWAVGAAWNSGSFHLNSGFEATARVGFETATNLMSAATAIATCEQKVALHWEMESLLGCLHAQLQALRAFLPRDLSAAAGSR